MIQLAVYSEILGAIQGAEPAHMKVVLGDMAEKVYACKDYSRYMVRFLDRFFAQVEAWQNSNPIETLSRTPGPLRDVPMDGSLRKKACG